MLPEALQVAREHCLWCAGQDMSPLDTLRSAGLKTARGHIPSWRYVEEELALQWLRMQGVINTRKTAYREEWSKAA